MHYLQEKNTGFSRYGWREMIRMQKHAFNMKCVIYIIVCTKNIPFQMFVYI